MVDNYFVYNRIRDLAKQGTSGYQSLDQYNRDAAQVSKDLAEVLAMNYEDNGMVADALSELLIISTTETVSVTGILELPDDYLHIDSIGTTILSKPISVQKIMRKEVDMVMSSAVRRFDDTRAVNPTVGYYKSDLGIQLLPKKLFPLEFRYIRKPIDPVLTLVLADDGDYEVLDPDATTDFEFGSSVTNLIIYLMLEKLGVQMKEQILTEYANIGIQRASLKPTVATQ